MEEALEVNGMAQFFTSRFQSPSDNSKFSLPTASVHNSVNRIYKDYFLISFCCLEHDGLLCKQLTHACILCAMLDRK